MDLSNIKMVVTDMDGTLLNSYHQVSTKFFNLFKELKKHNILFVAASGRQYNSIIDKLTPIKNDIIVVAENGAYAVQQEKELFSTPLTQEKVHQLVQIAQKIEGAHVVLCAKSNAYVLGDSDNFIEKMKQYYTEFIVLDSFENFNEEILKIAIYHSISSEHYIYPEVQQLEGDFKVKISGQNWLDLSHENANKGYAVEELQKQHNIQANETLVFGDYNNDLEMLANATYSFAMANAHPNVLEIANYKTHSNDDFGVERILEQLIASKN